MKTENLYLTGKLEQRKESPPIDYKPRQYNLEAIEANLLSPKGLEKITKNPRDSRKTNTFLSE